MKRIILPAMLTGCLALSSCGVGGGGDVFDEFDPVDVPYLPVRLEIYQDTLRVVADVDGVRYLAAKSAQDRADCLVMHEISAPQEAMAACSSGSWVGLESPALGSAILHFRGTSDDSTIGDLVSEWLEIIRYPGQ